MQQLLFPTWAQAAAFPRCLFSRMQVEKVFLLTKAGWLAPFLDQPAAGLFR